MKLSRGIISGGLLIGIAALSLAAFVYVRQSQNLGSGGAQQAQSTAADASTLTGTTLASNVVTSSLTALGTIANLTATRATITYGTTTDAWFHQIYGDASDGILVRSNSGTNVGIFGAGNSANTTLYGALNIDGATRLATSLSGLLQGASGAVSAITGTVGQFPYYSATNVLTATSSILVDTNQRVGISSTTPQRTLSVGGAIVASECNLTDGATVTFDLSLCNQGRVTLAGNRALDFTNETQALGQTIRVVVCQSTGSNTLTWDAAIRWAGGTAPTLTTTANKCDVIAGFTTGATSTTVILLDKVLNF